MIATGRPALRRAPPPRRRVGVGRPFVVMGLGVVTSYLFLFLFVLFHHPYDIWAGYALTPILLGAGLLLLRRWLPRVESDAWIRKLVMLGLVAKLLGAFARFYTNQYLLGPGDAYGYHLAGSAVAAEFRQLVFDGAAYNTYIVDLTGTRFIRLLTAVAYVFTGSTQLGGYVLFSFVSFWGLYLFYRAYSIALPNDGRRTYTALLFFLPSMVFWPSSIGKEAWLVTMLGLGSYGLARFLTQQRFGYLAIFASMFGMGIVRPHVAAIFGLSMAFAFVLRRSTGQGKMTRKVFGLVLLAVFGALVINQLQAFFGLDSPLDAQVVFDETARRSSQGGSQFETVQPTSIYEMPWAIVTVLFRPFIFEANSAAGLVTGAEGALLLALFVWNMPRLIGLPATTVRHPYLGYAVLYSLIFALSFSAVSNFGILARQRTQLFPIVMVLLTAIIAHRGDGIRTRRRAERASARPTPSLRPLTSHSQGPDPGTKDFDRRHRNLSTGRRSSRTGRARPLDRADGDDL